jgi:CheY-like chemotaxis protein
MANPTILLADNNELFLSTTAEYLERKGYKVLRANSPESARRILENEILALAIIDYRLRNDLDDTDESGYLLAHDTLRKASVPKVILTQFDNRIDTVVKALHREANGASAAVDYVFKKDGLPRLLEVVESSLRKVNVFLCYAHADGKAVEKLYDNLAEAGFTPWMDKRDLVGGENWTAAIKRAIRGADFFIACISRNSVSRRGFIQKEIKMAWELWDEKLKEDVYLIPARLEECDVLDDRFNDLQWVNLFKPQGFRNLVEALQVGLARRRNK